MKELGPQLEGLDAQVRITNDYNLIEQLDWSAIPKAGLEKVKDKHKWDKLHV